MSSTFRTGAVARMLRMPVATLRVWERRYHLTDTPRSPGGQRLYTSADVQRLALLKQLVDVGHAVGQHAGNQGAWAGWSGPLSTTFRLRRGGLRDRQDSGHVESLL